MRRRRCGPDGSGRSATRPGADPQPSGGRPPADDRRRDRRGGRRRPVDRVAPPQAADRHRVRPVGAAGQRQPVPGQRALPRGLPVRRRGRHGAPAPLRPPACSLRGAVADRAEPARPPKEQTDDRGGRHDDRRRPGDSLKAHYGAAARRRRGGAAAIGDGCGPRPTPVAARAGTARHLRRRPVRPGRPGRAARRARRRQHRLRQPGRPGPAPNRARTCSTSARAAASTCCCPPGGSGPPVAPTGST